LTPIVSGANPQRHAAQGNLPELSEIKGFAAVASISGGTARQLLRAVVTNRALRLIDETKPVARGKKTSLSH